MEGITATSSDLLVHAMLQRLDRIDHRLGEIRLALASAAGPKMNPSDTLIGLVIKHGPQIAGYITKCALTTATLGFMWRQGIDIGTMAEFLLKAINS